MLDEITLVNHIANLIHAPVRIYNADSERIYCIDNAKSIEDPLERDKPFEKRLLEYGDKATPKFFIEKDIILYVIIVSDRRKYIMGPCCCIANTGKASKYIVAAHYLDPSRSYMVSQSNINNIYQSALLLFKQISDIPMSQEKIILSNYNIKAFTDKVEKNMMLVYDQYRENSFIHNPYSQEKREQDAIKNGDVNALKNAINEVYIGKLGIMAKDELRSAKNIAITVLTLASRSAIEGGLLPEVAFSMADAYSMRIEEIGNAVEVEAIMRTAEYQFTELIHTIRDKKDQNPIIMGAKDYIVKHLNQKISLSELAQNLGVNASYLSDLFSKHEGETLSEYVLHEKVNAAKRQLSFTDAAYGEIALNYGFSSQSHFGKTFKRYTGMTPKEYRKLNKVTEIQ